MFKRVKVKSGREIDYIASLGRVNRKKKVSTKIEVHVASGKHSMGVTKSYDSKLFKAHFFCWVVQIFKEP